MQEGQKTVTEGGEEAIVEEIEEGAKQANDYLEADEDPLMDQGGEEQEGEQDASKVWSTNPTISLKPSPAELLPVSDDWFLHRFELLLSREQKAYCDQVWASGQTINSSVYKAWEELKCGSLANEAQAAKEPQSAKESQAGKELQLFKDHQAEKDPSNTKEPQTKEAMDEVTGFEYINTNKHYVFIFYPFSSGPQ